MASNKYKFSFTQQFNGEWFPAPKFITCCDCGLAHKVRFRRRGGKLEMCVHRHGPMTAARRRVKRMKFRRVR